MLSSHQVIQNCISATQSNIERTTKTFTLLSDIQLNWKQHIDSWSVGECLSHLVNSNGLYLNKIENILNLLPTGTENDFPYKQSFMGKMIVKGVDPSNIKKSKTFKVFYPESSNIKSDIIDDYIISSKKFIELARKTLSLDLRKYKLSSPVNNLIKLNLGDPFFIIPLHDERHLNQAERVMSHKDFPKG